MPHQTVQWLLAPLDYIVAFRALTGRWFHFSALLGGASDERVDAVATRNPNVALTTSIMAIVQRYATASYSRPANGCVDQLDLTRRYDLIL